MRPTTTAMITLALAAAALAGCSSTSGREPAASHHPTATTGTVATSGSTPTPGATPTAGASTHATAAAQSNPPAQPQPPPGEPRLTRRGLGGVPAGAPLGEFAAALGQSPTPMSATDRYLLAEYRCVIRQFAGLGGVGFMVIGEDPEGQVRRISIVQGSDVRTDTGIRIGSRLDDVRAVYGPGLDEPFDHYPVGGDAILVRAGTGSNLYLAFIGNDRDRVVEFRLGFEPEVLYPEGCV
jgi:hypothetical protein